MKNMSQSAVAEPEVDEVHHTEEKTQQEKRTKKNPKKLPPYNVILWNDDDHSFEYVIEMLFRLFAHPVEKGFELAKQVHEQGKTIVATTTKELAELKQEQIHAFGKDFRISACKGSMTATIEPSV